MQAPRRTTSQAWATHNISSWSYHFNVAPNGVAAEFGVPHFQEVAFVFRNLEGMGYNNSVAVDPFADKPKSYDTVATMMSRMWASFIATGDPNDGKGIFPREPSQTTLLLFAHIPISWRRRLVFWWDILTPSFSPATSVHWPAYTAAEPQNIVFDTNATNLAYIEQDYYRAEGIQYMMALFPTVYGR